MTKELKCEFQKEIDNEKVCKAFEVNRYGDIICQEEDCQLYKLKAENERLKAEFKIESLTDKTTRETIYRSNLVNKYRTILQEIKAIAEGRTKTEDYLLGQEYTELVDRILDLITKAEEE